MKSSNLPAVYESARANALDSYLSALLARRGLRDDLVAVAAFKGELEGIALKVHEPLIGEIRLQWWRDWLGSFDEGASGNPVADVFGAVMVRHGIDPALVLKMIDAQTCQLYDQPVCGLDEFVAHVRDFDGAGFALSARVCGATCDEAAEAFVGDAGHAYGTARVLARLRVFAGRGFWPLPVAPGGFVPASAGELVEDRNLDRDRRASVEYSLKGAREALRRCQLAPKGTVTGVGARAALAPLALVEPYFQAFERRTGDPLMMNVDVSPLERRLRLWSASWFGVVGRGA